MDYFWVRIYDYRKDDDLKEYTKTFFWDTFKGTLLDEYYLSGESLTRDEAKAEVKRRSGVDKFAKPRKGEGVYAIVMESDQFFYDRFYVELDTICFNCHRPIKGKAKDFPHITHGEERFYFCSYDCRKKTLSKTDPYAEGEWQPAMCLSRDKSAKEMNKYGFW